MNSPNKQADNKTDPSEEGVLETRRSRRHRMARKDKADSLGTKMLLTILALPLSFILIPWVGKQVNSLGVLTKPQFLGTVQKISYVGGLGPDTQVDTEHRTLLLSGAVVIEKGIALELRKGRLSSEVCIVKTDQCWHLMGS